MKSHIGAWLVLIVIGSISGLVVWQVQAHTLASQSGGPEQAAIAVEVAPIESGIIRDRRVLTGTLEASTRFVAAAKVGGLLEAVAVDIGDRIERDQVVAEIDDAEFVQAVAQAEAELAVRRAGAAQATADADLAEREYQRALDFLERAMASESEFDEKRAARESTRAALRLAEAQVTQAEAALELAKIQLGYTQVRANWGGGPETAIVGERFQDAGNTVQTNAAIVSVVTLDPLKAVVTVTERDYGRIAVGQEATLLADGAPGRTFDAVVTRIAPVFRETSRQARVELRVDNADGALKPGMFARIVLVLSEEEAAAIVPLAALVRRDGLDAVFVVPPGAGEVRLVPVEIGVVEGERVAIRATGLDGRVVVLGQQLLADGTPVRVHEGRAAGSDAGA